MKNQIKILHLEDSQADANVIAMALKNGKINGEILVVDSRTHFIQALEEFSPDIILSDHSLESFDSHQALQLVKKAGVTAPFILVTSTMADEIAVKLMKDGAHDYILKDRLNRLPSAIINLLEKQKWERERKSTNERIAFHMENSPLGFIEWDQDFMPKLWSKSAENIFGWKEREFLNEYKNGYSLIYEDDMPKVRKALSELVTGVVERNSVQHRNYTRDKRIIWCEWFNSVLKDKDGKVITIMSLVQDITERKLIEEKLAYQDTRYKEAQEVAHLGNWEFNLKTRQGIWSEEALRIYGLSNEDNNQTYEDWISFIHPDDVEYVLKECRLAQNTLSNMNMVHRIVLKDGTVKHIHTHSRFEFDQDGNPLGLYGIAHDVTEKRIFEESLKQSESRLKEAEAIAQLGNWEINFPDNSVVWSDELYKILGTTKEEVAPTREVYESFVHPDDLAYANSREKEALQTLQSSSFDFRLVRKDGAIIYAYNEWKFELDKNGKPVRMFGIIQDVTERKQAEMERTKMVQDLMLRNRDLEQFAYIVSHNLRAPVANILGASKGLKFKGLSMNEKELISNGLYESVTKLDNVVKDLNQVLQVKGQITEPKEKVIFSELCQDIKISIKNLIEKEHVEIDFNFSEIDEFFTLKSYLYSIFYNLISNSIKYRQPQIPCRVNISSQNVKNKVVLRFIDNGLGIDLQEKGEQVFGLYKRFHTNVEGKGMGLFMVKTQVETLGGKISLISEVNKGTEFKIEFDI